MKKITALALALFTVFSLCSCVFSSKELSSEVLGTLSNNVYLNSFLGLRFSPGPSWHFEDEGALYEKMGFSAKAFASEKERLAALSKESTIFVAIAEDESGGNSVEIRLEDLSVGTAFYDETEYADIIRSQLETAEDGEYKVEDYSYVMLSDREYLHLTAKTAAWELELEHHYLIRKVDNYMATVIITQTLGYGLTFEEMTELFSSYD